MLRRLRSWLAGMTRFRPPWVDLVLMLAFSVGAVWFAARAGHLRSGHSSPGLPRELSKALRTNAAARPDSALIAVQSLLITVPLAWRRRLPLAALIVQFLGVLVVRDGLNLATILALLVGGYSLTVSDHRPLLTVGALLAAAVVSAVSLHAPPKLPGRLIPFVIVIPIGLLGVTVRTARARATASAQRAEAVRRGQEAVTQTAVAQERARIARELHDVVSHHVSVMVIQAGAAGKVIDTRPDLVREALGVIETCGREAMGELRHLLGVLNPDQDNPDTGDALLHPQPGLDQLDVLTDRMRGAGQPVTLRCDAAGVPRGVEIAAYRVVQEALTNALRYAPGARTDVVVERREGELVVEVTNDEAPGRSGGSDRPGASDRTARAAAAVGTGSGLVGLAERLRFHAGALEAGRRLGGGFRVCARIPLEDV